MRLQPPDFSVQNPTGLFNLLSQWWKCLTSLTFQDNMQGTVASVSVGVANSNIAVAHNLGYTPTNYIAVGQSVSGIIYDGTGTWDNTNISLKFTATGTYRVFIF